MTTEELKNLALPVQESDLLYVEGALEWIKKNTTLEVVAVSSESVGPMSQSFFDSGGDRQLRCLARQF